MKLVGKTSMAAAVATAALTLALGGVALAAPMVTAGAMGGLTVGGQFFDNHMGTTDTIAITTSKQDTMMEAGTYASGSMMGGTIDTNSSASGSMMNGTTDTTSFGPGSMMGGTIDTNGTVATGTGLMGPGYMFSDVAAGEWYQLYAEHMAESGFMRGFADGTFGGYQTITRGQFAGVMARMMGLEPADGSSFTDTTGFWGAAAVEVLAQNGIVAGYSNGAFGPYDDVTRAQMAAMMDRAWEWMAQNGVGTGMGDVDMTQLREEMRQRLHDVQGTWAEDHIAHMFQLGVVQGDRSGMFRPQAITTRAQASAMIWRWYEAGQQ